MWNHRCVLILSLSAAVVTVVSADSPEEYNGTIKPLLHNKCISCHGAIKQEGGLRLDTVALMRRGGDSGSAIDPVAANEPPLILQRISNDDAGDQMPPDAAPLTRDQIDAIADWLRGGAVGPAEEKPQQDPAEHWAFHPPVRPALPPALGNRTHPVDRFIDKKLSLHGLHPVESADTRTLIRRLFLDLHGLPPAPAEIDRWQGEMDGGSRDRAAGIGRLVDWLLASPRYGERWAQHWLDVVRYADTHGFEVNTPRPNAWPYRDFVVEALNSDLPYDQFITQQLAGDTVGDGAATGFLVSAAVLLPGQIGKDEASKRLARQDALDEIVVGTSATFLGLTIGCARCHDHKFDPITQRDYYSLQAFFSGVHYGDRMVVDAGDVSRQKQTAILEQQIAQLHSKIGRHAAPAFTGQTIVIDDEDAERVTVLREIQGHGTNPKGSSRGYKDDRGTALRLPNLSRGRYTWWLNAPGEDVFTWNPNTRGRYRIWVSWGTHGSGVHTHDARYILDRDGDLKTRDDQLQIAVADQYYHAGLSSGSTEQKPMWSGLRFAGIHDFDRASRIVLRCGESERGITADVIVMQEVTPATENVVERCRLPMLREPVSAKVNVERFKPTEAKYVRWTSLATIDDNKHQPCIDELEVYAVDDPTQNVGLASAGAVATSSGNYATTGKHQLKHVNDGIYGNDRSWISNEYGRGWVQLEIAEPTIIDRVCWGRDRTEKFRDRLGIRYTVEISRDGEHWTMVASHRDRMAMGIPRDERLSLIRNAAIAGSTGIGTDVAELGRLEARLAELQKPKMVYAGIFRDPDPTHLLYRGDPEQPGDRVTPQVPAILTSMRKSTDLAPDELTPEDLTPDESATTGSSLAVGDAQRRRNLADWLSEARNPLTARVMVNRIWQYHFGRGLVETSSDFGLSGSPPTHPELLDWLAVEFVESGWSIKAMHRTIVSSQAYQRSHRIVPEAATRDADSKLLWRFPARRLEGEAIRDGMLFAAGNLNLQMGGPGFNFFKSRGGLSGFPPVEEFTGNQLRRMIYAHKVRMEPVPVFGAFDCPDAGQPTPLRSRSTTPIQALNLFNSPFVIQQADAFAKRLQRDHSDDLDAQVRRAFQIALGRAAEAGELQQCRQVAGEHGLSAVCRVLINSNEFLFLP